MTARHLYNLESLNIVWVPPNFSFCKFILTALKFYQVLNVDKFQFLQVSLLLLSSFIRFKFSKISAFASFNFNSFNKFLRPNLFFKTLILSSVNYDAIFSNFQISCPVTIKEIPWTARVITHSQKKILLSHNFKRL